MSSERRTAAALLRPGAVTQRNPFLLAAAELTGMNAVDLALEVEMVQIETELATIVAEIADRNGRTIAEVEEWIDARSD